MLKFINDPHAGWDREILLAASEFKKLKHGVELIKTIYTAFRFEDATDPRFFNQTDIFIGGNELYKGQLVEEFIIKQSKT